MLWNNCVFYGMTLPYWIILCETLKIVYVVDASNNNVVKVSRNAEALPCYVCKNRTVEEAIKFHKFEDHYDGK